MKLLIDMNFVHWTGIGQPSAPDSQIMDYARANGLVVFTHDLDFARCEPARGS